MKIAKAFIEVVKVFKDNSVVVEESVINLNVNETTEEYMNGVYVDIAEDTLVENPAIKSVKVIPTGFKYVK